MLARTILLGLVASANIVLACEDAVKQCGENKEQFDQLSPLGLDCKTSIKDAIDQFGDMDPSGKGKAQVQPFFDSGEITDDTQILDYCAKSCGMCDAPVKGTAVIQMDYEQISKVKQQFMTNFSTEVCAFIKKGPSCITVTDIRAGSVIVDFTVNPTNGTAPIADVGKIHKGILGKQLTGFIGSNIVGISTTRDKGEGVLNLKAVIAGLVFVIFFICCLCPCLICCCCCKRCWPLCCLRCCRSDVDKAGGSYGGDGAYGTEREDKIMHDLEKNNRRP